MALYEQELTQILQFRHFASIINALPLRYSIASVGQMLRQTPQAVHFSKITSGYLLRFKGRKL